MSYSLNVVKHPDRFSLSLWGLCLSSDVVASLSTELFSQAKDKEERLIKRQQNRERLEEQHKQTAVDDEGQGITISISVYQVYVLPAQAGLSFELTVQSLL